MNKETLDLYHQLILDHSRSPRNRWKMPAPDYEAQGDNTLCGDHIHLFLEVKDDVIQDMTFEGNGCAIFTASASMMTEHIKGRNLSEALIIFEDFRSLVTVDLQNTHLGSLQAFAGVKDYPARVKCAILPWHTLKAAIKGDASVSTE